MRGKLVYLALMAALVVAGGCSKQGMVKKDEGIAPAPAAAPAAKAANDVGGTKPAVSNNATTAPTAAKPQAAVDNGAPDKAAAAVTTEQLKQALQRIYFDFDSYVLSKEDRATLQKNQEVLKQSDAKVRIEGNCDERGSDDYNLALGEKRAQEAKKYLVTLGIPADRLTVISYGKEKPVDAGHDEAAWAKNRRDEFVVQ